MKNKGCGQIVIKTWRVDKLLKGNGFGLNY